jgi:hypothetical protein
VDDSLLFAAFGAMFVVLAVVIEARYRQRSSGRRWARGTLIVGGIGILELLLAVLLRVV